MLNREKHQLIMGQILRDIYTDTTISPLLGFKGGTCAYFFYGLIRFSVDLDLDLFSSDEATQKLVYKKIGGLLGKYGEVKDEIVFENLARLEDFTKFKEEVLEYISGKTLNWKKQNPL